MTIIEALEILKGKGITTLTGMYNQSDINVYIDNAIQSHENSIRWADVPCHKYSLDREDQHYMVETNGHHIIVTQYENFDMATYSDYDTEKEMYAAFDEWNIARDAEVIADEMATKRPNGLPRTAWVLIATSELRTAHEAAHAAFERKYPSVN